METPRKQTNGELIFQTCVDLTNAGRAITRTRLEELTELRISVIDEHVTRLINEKGLLRRVTNGNYELVEQFPARRAVSVTAQADGQVCIEVGDDILKVYPSEWKVIAKYGHADALEMVKIQDERQVYDTVDKLLATIRDNEKRMEQMAASIVRLQQRRRRAHRGQGQLFERGTA